MEPKLGDLMKVNPSLTGLTDWIEGQVIDVEHNPFMGLVISIKDNLGRIFFGQSKYFYDSVMFYGNKCYFTISSYPRKLRNVFESTGYGVLEFS